MKDIIEFIKNQVNEAKANGVVLGISGGIDSAVVAVLSKKALDKNVILIYMPEQFETNDDIVKLCKKFDMAFAVHPIGDELNKILEGFSERLDKVTIGNIKARLRMLILYTYANEHNFLVIGTTNKSELLTGYFTKYGDGGVDFEPIAHLYKTEVIELAKELGIPKEIIDKPPSADLWDNQTDEQELGMSYKKLDKILRYIEETKDIDDDTYKKLRIPLKDIVKVLKIINNSYHKTNPPETLK